MGSYNFRSYRKHLIPLFFSFYLAVLYLLYSIPIFTNDEVTFFKMAKENVAIFKSGGLFFFFQIENKLSYGSFYWILNTLVIALSESIYTLITGITNDLKNSGLGLYALRQLYFFIWGSIPFLIYFSTDKSHRRLAWIPMLSWLILPAAFWTGKVTGPDHLAMFFAILSLFTYLKFNNFYLSALFLGCSIGIRPNYIIVLSFIFTDLILKESWKKLFPLLFYCGLLLIIGVLITNPIILYSPTKFIFWINRVSGNFKLDGEYMIHILYNHHSDGDSFNGGLVQNWFGLIGIPFFLLIIWKLRVSLKDWLPLAVGFLIYFLLSLRSNRYFGWYAFPFIVLTPFFLVQIIKRYNLKIRKNAYLFILLFFAITIANSERIYKNIYYRILEYKEHYDDELNIDNQRCLKQKFQGFAPELVLDFSSPLVSYRLKYLQSVQERRPFGPLSFKLFHKILQDNETDTHAKKIAILIMRTMEDFFPSIKFQETRLPILKKWKVNISGQCNYLSYFLIEKKFTD